MLYAIRHLAIAVLHVSCRRSTGICIQQYALLASNVTRSERFHMPEEHDNEKTPFSAIWEIGDKIVLAMRRWFRLNRNERIDVILIIIAGTAAALAFGS